MKIIGQWIRFHPILVFVRRLSGILTFFFRCGEMMGLHRLYTITPALVYHMRFGSCLIDTWIRTAPASESGTRTREEHAHRFFSPPRAIAPAALASRTRNVPIAFRVFFYCDERAMCANFLFARHPSDVASKGLIPFI